MADTLIEFRLASYRAMSGRETEILEITRDALTAIRRSAEWKQAP